MLQNQKKELKEAKRLNRTRITFSDSCSDTFSVTDTTSWFLSSSLWKMPWQPKTPQQPHRHSVVSASEEFVLFVFQPLTKPWPHIQIATFGLFPPRCLHRCSAHSIYLAKCLHPNRAVKRAFCRQKTKSRAVICVWEMNRCLNASSLRLKELFPRWDISRGRKITLSQEK